MSLIGRMKVGFASQTRQPFWESSDAFPTPSNRSGPKDGPNGKELAGTGSKKTNSTAGQRLISSLALCLNDYRTENPHPDQAQPSRPELDAAVALAAYPHLFVAGFAALASNKGWARHLGRGARMQPHAAESVKPGDAASLARQLIWTRDWNHEIH